MLTVNCGDYCVAPVENCNFYMLGAIKPCLNFFIYFYFFYPFIFGVYSIFFLKNVWLSSRGKTRVVCVLIPDIALSPQPSATEVCTRRRRLIKQRNFIYTVHFKNRGNSTCFTHTDEKDYKKTERLTASQHTPTQATSFKNSKLVFALTATSPASEKHLISLMV